jgi:membrane protein required for colicin V production
VSSLSLNITDVVVLILILASSFLSFFRGFLKELLSITAWITAIIFGVYGSNFLNPYFSDLEPKISLIHWVSGGLIGFIVLILMILFNHHLSNRFNFNNFKAINRSLGFLFGLVRGFFLMSLAFLVIQSFIGKNTNSTWIEKSKTRILLQNGANAIIYLMPNHIDEHLDKIGLTTHKRESPLVFENLNLPAIKPNPSNGAPGYTAEQRAIIQNTIKKLK